MLNASSVAPPRLRSSSGCRQSVNVGKNHPAAVTARVEAMGCPTKSTSPPALCESPTCASKDRAIANLERMARPSLPMAEVVLEDADKNDEDNPDDDASSSLDDVEASPPPSGRPNTVHK
jgi:hypothetical protein